MKIDKKLLQKMAHLSRIEIAPEKEESLMKDMEQIISWVEKLDKLDVGDVEPLRHMTFEENAFREDVPQKDISTEQALKNAPDRKGDFFSVPKVIKKPNE